MKDKTVGTITRVILLAFGICAIVLYGFKGLFFTIIFCFIGGIVSLGVALLLSKKKCKDTLDNKKNTKNELEDKR